MIFLDQNLTPSPAGDLFNEFFGKDFLPGCKVVCIKIRDFNLLDKTVSYNYFQENNCDFVVVYDLHGWNAAPTDLNLCPIPTFCLHYDFRLYKNNTKHLKYFPNWLLSTANMIVKTPCDQTAEYLFSCANRNFNNGRKGKIYNYQLLKRKPYFDKILFTKYKSIEDFDLTLLPPKDEDLEFHFEFGDFLLDYETFPILNYNELSLTNSMCNVNLSVYKKSLFHIVAETTIEEFLLSEKTWKVILVGQIPIMCAAYKSVEHMRQLGFDMFDDLVDHSYDNIVNWKDRIRAMHKSLDKLLLLDHSTLLEITKERRLKNISHLQNIKWHAIDPIKEDFNKYFVRSQRVYAAPTA